MKIDSAWYSAKPLQLVMHNLYVNPRDKSVLVQEKGRPTCMNAINNDFNMGSGRRVVDYKAKNDSSVIMMILEPEWWQNHPLLVAPHFGIC